MPSDVAETFLHDPIDADGDFVRQRRYRIIVHIGALDTRAGRKVIDKASHSFRQSQIIQDGWMKTIGHLTYIVRNEGDAFGHSTNLIP